MRGRERTPAARRGRKEAQGHGSRIMAYVMDGAVARVWSALRQGVGPALARCEGVLGGELLKIRALSDALGGHACECGHPEMRLLPDGVFRCPACRAEVLPHARS